jgi:quercetin dioxygenase-like cupin family protein
MNLDAPPVVGRADSSVRPWNLLLGAPETEGAAMVGSGVLPPRTAGPPLHVHTNEDEAFYVCSGVLTAQFAQRRLELNAGEVIWLPRGIPHAFANLSDQPTSIVSLVVPGALSEMFREQDAYLRDVDGDPDPAILAEISIRHGVHPVGPPLQIG